MDRLNLFNPFDSLPKHHEDRLTWAFLVVLKCDPFLQNFLRELVESRLPPELRKHGNTWETVNVSTQTRGIGSSTIPLVSILLTDAPIQEEIRVQWSDRNDPRYDGVIEYPSCMTLIIENKLYHGDVWREQLSPRRSSFSGDIDDDTLHGSAICLEWSEILEGVLKYVDSDLASFGSRLIARDFLSFVGEVHPALTPYRTFKLCGERSEALQRRTSRLVDDLAKKMDKEDVESRDGYLFRPGKIAERVVIRPESRKLKIGLAPADTVGQARRFYDAVDKAAFLSLKEWKVEPNLHFSFMGTHLVWAETALGTREYFDHFSESSSYGQRSADRETLEPLANQWEHEGLISSADRKKIEDKFINTNRKNINIIPGFSIYREWDLDRVIKLEEREELETNIIDALATPLETWEKRCRA